MKRKTFDFLVSGIGVLLTVVLLLAGGLLTWANSFVNDQVKTQLVQQQIVMPEASAFSDLNEYTHEDINALKPFAGKPMTTGDQAAAFANHYLGAHLRKTGGGVVQNGVVVKEGLTYSQAKDPDMKATLFQGETLRGPLLNAYAFGTMGRIAGIAAVAAWIAGGLMLVLTVLGFWHARRTPAEQDLTLGRQAA